MSRRTPKQRVLAVYPKAFCFQWAGPTYVIYRPYERMSGNESLNLSAPTPQAAWRRAWETVRSTQ